MPAKAQTAVKPKRKSAAVRKAATARKATSARRAMSARKPATARKATSSRAAAAPPRSAASTHVKRKRFTPAKSAEDEAGLVKFTRLLEATPRTKVARLTKNPVYAATNMTTIKNYLRMKGMRITGRKQELVQRMHQQILKEKEAAYGPPADLNDDGRTLRSETEAYMAAVRTGLTDDEGDDDNGNAANDDSSGDDDDATGGDKEAGRPGQVKASAQSSDDEAAEAAAEDEEQEEEEPAAVATRLTFKGALSPIGDRSVDDDEEEDVSRRQSGASPFLPSSLDAPGAGPAIRKTTGLKSAGTNGSVYADEHADDFQRDEDGLGNFDDPASGDDAVAAPVETVGEAAAQHEPATLKHHVVDVTQDAVYYGWHLPKLTLVLLVAVLLALHFEAAFHVQGVDTATLELTTGWTLVVLAINAVYLSANAS